MHKLNSDVIGNILQFTDYQTIYNCMEINKQCYDLINHNQVIWKRLNDEFYHDIELLELKYDNQKHLFEILTKIKWFIGDEFFNSDILSKKYIHNAYIENIEAISLPDVICLMYNIEKLTVIDIPSNIPTELSKLDNLTELTLIDCNIDIIPIELTYLKNLVHLDLTENEITIVPKEIGQLSNLKLLCLGANYLMYIPDEIGLLTNLKILSIDHNYIFYLPITIKNLSNVTDFDVSANELEEIPEEIKYLTSLQYFYVNDNSLTIIPEGLGLLPNLVFIGLANNMLDEFPENLCNVSSLYLDDNYIENITIDINLFAVHLRNLGLNNNNISNLPDGIVNLNNLRYLKLENNPLSDNDKELLDYMSSQGCNVEY